MNCLTACMSEACVGLKSNVLQHIIDLLIARFMFAETEKLVVNTFDNMLLL